MAHISLAEVEHLTEKYGGQWGINHSRRLLKMVKIIGEGLPYDEEIVWLSALLHDWGAYAPWAIDGVDHVVRSVEVAEEFLKENGFSEEVAERVLECIRYHHKGSSDNRIEAILLRDADGLDFLGVVGVLRDFSKNPKKLRTAYESVLKRRSSVPYMLCLDRSKEIAQKRIAEMDELLEIFEEETDNHF